MTLREREIENEKLNSAVIIPQQDTTYCSRESERMNVNLSKGQVDQNPLRCI